MSSLELLKPTLGKIVSEDVCMLSPSALAFSVKTVRERERKRVTLLLHKTQVHSVNA
jgi:hypothetical protein